MEKLKKRVYLSSPTMHPEEKEYVEEAFKTNWIAPLGKNVDEFENEICKLTGAQASLALCSGTAALHMAVKLAGVKPKDIVFCQDLTFSATVNPVSYENGVQVFIDSERKTWNMSPKALEAAFAKYPDTRVVIAVNLYGIPAMLDEIKEICKAHNAILIEDAAESLSSEYKGLQTGTFGDLGVFSFNGNKIITTSGGGMLISDDISAVAKARFWATQSREPVPWYQHEEIGYNYRLSNVSAGIGRGQLKHLAEHKALKTKIYNIYKNAFSDLPVLMNPYLDYTSPNFWLSCMIINKGTDTDPMSIYEKLSEKNIESRPIWKPMHMQPVFKNNDFIFVEKKPVSEDIFKRGLCLPSDIKMTEEDQEMAVNVVKQSFSGNIS